MKKKFLNEKGSLIIIFFIKFKALKGEKKNEKKGCKNLHIIYIYHITKRNVLRFIHEIQNGI